MSTARLTALALSVLYVPFLWFYGVKLLGAEFVDFPSFYAGARVLLQGGSPYDPQSIIAALPEAGTPVFPFLYPPPSILLFLPLTLLPYKAAGLVMLALNHLALLGCLCLLGRRFGTLPTTVVMLLASGVALTITHGQINLVALLSLLAAWECMERDRPVAAGVALALAVLLKTYPVLLLPLLLMVGKWRDAAGAILILALTGAIAAVVVPFEVWQEWLFKVVPSGGFLQTPLGLFPPDSGWNQSLNGFFSRLFLATNPVLGNAVATIAALAVLAASALAVWRQRTLASVFLIGLPATFLIAPLSWDHHTVFLLASLLALVTVTEGVLFTVGCVLAAALMPAVTLSLKFYAAVALWLASLSKPSA